MTSQTLGCPPCSGCSCCKQLVTLKTRQQFCFHVGWTKKRVYGVVILFNHFRPFDQVKSALFEIETNNHPHTHTEYTQARGNKKCFRFWGHRSVVLQLPRESRPTIFVVFVFCLALSKHFSEVNHLKRAHLTYADLSNGHVSETFYLLLLAFLHELNFLLHFVLFSLFVWHLGQTIC